MRLPFVNVAIAGDKGEKLDIGREISVKVY